MTRAGRAMVGTLAVVVALALSACGKSVTSGGASGGGSAAGTAAEKVYQQLNGLPANQQRAQAIAQAKKEGTLELYTSLTDDVAAEVKQAFEQQTGVKTNVFRANSETVLQRVLQETSANRTGNDAVETNFGEMGQLSKQGVLADYLGAGQTAVDGMNYSYITQNTADKGAPVAFRSADGIAHTIGFARPQGVALMKGAKHPAAAWLFSDWMLSDGQKLLVSLGLTPSVKIAGDNSLQGVTLEPYDVQGLTQDSKTWDDRYDQLLRGLEQIGGD